HPTRQPHDEVVAEPVHRVVGAPPRDTRQRLVAPVRELRVDETADEPFVDPQLVGVHPPAHAASMAYGDMTTVAACPSCPKWRPSAAGSPRRWKAAASNVSRSRMPA